MKKKIFATCAASFALLALSPATANAQETEEEAYPYQFFGVGGGGFHQLTERDYTVKNQFVPLGAAQLGGMFNPYVGLRLDVSGWKERGRRNDFKDTYKMGFLAPSLDVMLDVTNFFYGKKKHLLHLYAVGGAGFAVGRGHCYDKAGYAATTSRFSFSPRAGLQLEAKVARFMGVYAEALAVNLTNGGKGEWRLQPTVGFNFYMGKGKGGKKLNANTALAAQDWENSRYAANANANAPRTEVKPAAKPEPKPAPKPEAKPAPVNPGEKNVRFTINSTDLQNADNTLFEKVAAYAKEVPAAKVYVTGYADAGTGTPAINMALSKKRAENAAARLRESGVPANRIVTDWKGDTVQPFANNDDNRTVIVYVK